MPPAVAAAGVAAVGAGAQTYLQSRANERATNREDQARREAMAYEDRRQQADYQQRLNDYNAYRDWYGRRYGVELPAAQGATGSGNAPIVQGAALGALQQRYGGMKPGGMSLGDFARPNEGVPSMVTPHSPALPGLEQMDEQMNDGADWNQWG